MCYLRLITFYRLITLFFFYNIFSQEDFSNKISSIKLTYDSLFLKKNYRFVLNDSLKKIISHRISKEITQLLKETNNFFTSFTDLPFINSLYSPDSLIRIITWYYKDSENNYKYEGLLLKKNQENNNFSIYNLTQKFYNHKDTSFLFSTIHFKEWLGCIYYDILKFSTNKKVYYLLFGWDGYNKYLNRKIVDVLYFKKGTPYFGLPIFIDINKTYYRLVFNYSEKANFVCKYVKEKNSIIIDYLSPVCQDLKNFNEFYVPDGTYDGYTFSNGKWYYKKNIIIKNLEEQKRMKKLKNKK